MLEVAIYAFAPAAGAVLADWGADVVKVEHPQSGDPLRGLVAYGVKPGEGGVTYLWEVLNRGKRSIGIDIATDDGRELLLSLCEGADVFLTNFLAPARQRLGIDADAVMARNPRIIYARGTGHGPKGPDADKGGYDGVSFWARSGVSIAAMPPENQYPVPLPGPAYGDIQSGAHLAGGIAAALFQRERTGQGGDGRRFAARLRAVGHAADHRRRPRLGPGAARTARPAPAGQPAVERVPHGRRPVPRPVDARGRPVLAGFLRGRRPTRAHRRRALRRPPTPGKPTTRRASSSSTSCSPPSTLAEWKEILGRQEGPWSVTQTPRAALDDEQAAANDYLQWVKYDNGATLPLVHAPAQIDGRPATLGPPPATAPTPTRSSSRPASPGTTSSA